jgi:hypothetical protein
MKELPRCKLALLALVVASTPGWGCGHAKGAPDEYNDWTTVRTAHFEVHSPMSSGAAAESAQQLELVYAALTTFMFPHAQIPPIEVLVFERDPDAKDAVAQSVGPSSGGRPPGGTLVLVSRVRRSTQRSAIDKFSTPWQVAAAHDIASRLIKSGLPHAPPWFSLGLVRYLETVQVEPGKAKFGRREPLLEHELQSGRVIPLGQMLAENNKDFHRDWPRSHEASAWGFINYLLTADGGSLRPRFDLVAATLESGPGGAAASRRAVEDAFPGLPLGELETRVRDYDVEILGRQTMFPSLSIDLPPQPPPQPAPTSTEHVRGLLLAQKR